MKQKAPDPLIIPPTSLHTHTFILLHGRGSNAQRFAFDTSVPDKLGILVSKSSSGHTLPRLFPGMKFILPTAPQRRCTAMKRTMMNIWFNTSSFDDPSEREELQPQGLRENAAFISQIIRAEARTLGTLSKVFLGGLSQGCAMALHVLLSFEAEGEGEGKGLGGFVGMSGWLPFYGAISAIIAGEDDEVDENPFAEEGEDGRNEENVAVKVTRFVRTELMDLPECQEEALASRRTPVFYGHGDRDTTVDIQHGRNILAVLKALDYNISCKVYEGQGHWYKVPEEIDSIAEFISANL